MTNRIFTITPGRSGIHWLSAFFWVMARELPHTAKPEYFPPAIPNPEDVEKIVDDVWEKLPDPYVSTSLMPKNGYLEALGNKGARFIHLKRPIRHNAYSWYRMDGVPGRTPRGLGYHPIPASPNNEIDILGFWEELTDYQLCLWLCMEVDARADKMSEKYDVYTIDLYDITVSTKFAKELLDWSGIQYNMSWWELLYGKVVHEAPRSGLRDALGQGERAEDERDLNRIIKEKHEISDCILP